MNAYILVCLNQLISQHALILSACSDSLDIILHVRVVYLVVRYVSVLIANIFIATVLIVNVLICCGLTSSIACILLPQLYCAYSFLLDLHKGLST